MKLTVNIPGKAYDITIENGALSHIADYIDLKGKCAIITDSNVDEFHADTVVESLASKYDVYKFVFPAGEESKTIYTLNEIYGFLADNSFNRGDFIVALGGGVVGDTAGFAAATYMRGIKYVQIPTTLLAQVDSSVGGKVAVDLSQGKNMIGNFYQPHAVIIDPTVLKTLSPDFFADGMAEVIKYGCIEDADLFDKLRSYSKEEFDANIENIIYTCVDIKRRYVEEDELDTGVRMKLNFGHTIGHVIEKYYNYSTLSHGRAVAIGMNYVTILSEKLGVTKAGSAEKIVECLKKYDLPYEIDTDVLEKSVEFIGADKKNIGKQLNVIMLEEIGKSFIHKTDTKVFGGLF